MHRYVSEDVARLTGVSCRTVTSVLPARRHIRNLLFLTVVLPPFVFTTTYNTRTSRYASYLMEFSGVRRCVSEDVVRLHYFFFSKSPSSLRGCCETHIANEVEDIS